MAKVDIPLAELQKRRLFVATPMYGGQCMGPYAKACLDLQALCMKYRIEVQFYYLFNESLITRARNYLVDEFLRSNATHLMFIDSDITFEAQDVLALLALDKPINGGPYPKKTISWEKIYDAAKLGMVDDNPNKLELFAGDYVMNVPPGTTQIKMDEPAEVLEIGTGFMMVKREVFEKFRDAYPEFSYRPDHNRSAAFNGTREIHMYFQALIDPESKRYLSEDYMFCQWARKIGIPVYICPWMKLPHTGTYVFQGDMNALAALSHRQRERGVATPVVTSSQEVVTDAQRKIPTAPAEIAAAAGLEPPPHEAPVEGGVMAEALAEGPGDVA